MISPRSLLGLVPLLAIASQANAECRFHNTLTEPQTEPETRESLCKPQGADSWTFAMDISQVAVPTFDGDNPWGGLAGNNAFILYDNACIPRGVYSPDNEGNDCGVPYVIQEDFLPYVLTVTSVNMDLGGGYFYFTYANGAYMIGENDATCEDISSGLEGEMGCKTGFPINGEPA